MIYICVRNVPGRKPLHLSKLLLDHSKLYTLFVYFTITHGFNNFENENHLQK